MIKVFLGGTCNGSAWRGELIKQLNIEYFDPVVKDWNDRAQQEEIFQRAHCDYCLYVITPKMAGVYSIAEVIDDSNKRPEKTLFCVLREEGTTRFDEGEWKSLTKVSEMVYDNGGKIFSNLLNVLN